MEEGLSTFPILKMILLETNEGVLIIIETDIFD